ncbi:MAG: 3'(2'),5'-bisphosphate nucleotidase CysQ [Pseudomonadota bacterium]
MQGPDLALLHKAALAAGEIAERHFRTDIQTWTKDRDDSPVTAADLEIDAMLRDQLLGARPGYGWLSEETEDSTARLDQDTVFIIDPIDGTRSFIAGESNFSHSLAIAHRGVVQAAVVHLPMKSRTYLAERGQGTFLNGERVSASARGALEGADILTAKASLADTFWSAGTPPAFNRHFRPSLAYRLALVAEGRFDAMMTLRPTWEWDVAAGVLLCEEAGATVSDQHGAAPLFNNPHPKLPGLLAGSQGVHAQTRLALAD